MSHELGWMVQSTASQQQLSADGCYAVGSGRSGPGNLKPRDNWPVASLLLLLQRVDCGCLDGAETVLPAGGRHFRARRTRGTSFLPSQERGRRHEFSPSANLKEG
jgi:hypothetical protein